jgi:alkanesulfonate monooxygenase SsuD/methylene tetrahydromethanopterin reductase-like flavin-dependent oxidoreductase (luciferase family)
VRLGGVPLLMGGHAPRAIDRAARLADGFIIDGGTDPDAFATKGHNRDLFDRVASAFDVWRRALARHGRQAERPRFLLTLGGFLADGGADEAWELVQDAYVLTRRVYGDWYGLDPATYERWYPELMAPEEHARRRAEVWLGAPSDLVAGFERLRDLTDDTVHVMFRCKYPGVPDAATRRSIELLGGVRDHFRR